MKTFGIFALFLVVVIFHLGVDAKSLRGSMDDFAAKERTARDDTYAVYTKNIVPPSIAELFLRNRFLR
ncbi:unnamed protein product [Caenorhabditis auriculariae]|uniref:Uncharacterized protein n=1 Tax=Caenorhabditis auriculariae TaxID=2777116 RepID=A0A8S1GY30_9PELO|nr:unnamed protein product [Caenorhabditis auriculariae]